jgi:DNA topoisomerase-2
MQNSEMFTLISTLGLDKKRPNYGELVICADADIDGKHIEGLILNNLRLIFPDTLHKIKVSIMSTPIIRVNKGKEHISFYKEANYTNWSKTVELKKWVVNYFKGLGTSSEEQIEADYKNKNFTRVIFDEQSSEALDMIFSNDLECKKLRKEWISNHELGDEPERIEEMDVSEYVVDNVLCHAKGNIKRCIGGIDGLKSIQRKTVYTSLCKIWKVAGTTESNKRKVNNICSSTIEYTHHEFGEKSVLDAIIKMAQSFTGSNNMNFFVDKGSFGTRFYGRSKGYAAPRYLYAWPNWWAKSVYRKEDIPIYEYLIKEGHQAEPFDLLPIVPLHIINGSRGIATGLQSRVQ